MRLHRLCFEPRGGFFIAIADTGVFRVPNERGGWARRTAWPYSVVCKPAPANAPEFLGMVQRPLSGCNCLGARR